MKNNFSFTFVLPVHNGGEYVKEQIESILSQDYENFNLIVLENCSDDGTYEYLKSIDNPKLTILPSDKLLSMEENWSRVLETQRGDYTIFAMADDKYEKIYLSEIVKLINKYPDKNIYRTNVTVINELSEVIGKSNIKGTINFYEYLKGRLAHTYFETFQGYCFDTKFYNKSGGIECIYKAMYMDDKFVLTAIDKDFMPVSPKHACCYRVNEYSVSANTDFSVTLGGYNYLFNWLYSLNDKIVNKIVYDCLPYHLMQLEDVFTDEEIQQHKEIYKLYNINEKDLYHKKIIKKIRRSRLKIFEHLFSIKNEYQGKIKMKVLRILGFEFLLKSTNK